MAYATDGYLGAEFTRRTTAPEHNLGQVVHGTGNTVWIYVKASANIAANDVVLVSSTFTAATDVTNGKHTADTAFTSGEYGWVRQTAGATG
jgi:hypothetical protein